MDKEQEEEFEKMQAQLEGVVQPLIEIIKREDDKQSTEILSSFFITMKEEQHNLLDTALDIAEELHAGIYSFLSSQGMIQKTKDDAFNPKGLGKEFRKSMEAMLGTELSKRKVELMTAMKEHTRKSE